MVGQGPSPKRLVHNTITITSSATTDALYYGTTATDTFAMATTVAVPKDETWAIRNAIRALREAERSALVRADRGVPRPGYSLAHFGDSAVIEHRSPGSRQRRARKASRR